MDIIQNHICYKSETHSWQYLGAGKTEDWARNNLQCHPVTAAIMAMNPTVLIKLWLGEYRVSVASAVDCISWCVCICTSCISITWPWLNTFGLTINIIQPRSIKFFPPPSSQSHPFGQIAAPCTDFYLRGRDCILGLMLVALTMFPFIVFAIAIRMQNHCARRAASAAITQPAHGANWKPS